MKEVINTVLSKTEYIFLRCFITLILPKLKKTKNTYKPNPHKAVVLLTNYAILRKKTIVSV